ncbi:hypothetical protein F8M41_026316 [Gigaspora margarita]|uniref:Uncharacterized protein n=1 Tax=Gigaspora margarita TaxID=4874 RepID=A0A8H3XIQ1_GIGMA|nr:hypothetical protein F8M41_026316 [Gigaspora margarita]
MPENSPSDTKGVQELISMKSSLAPKSAKEQNAREFTIQCQRYSRANTKRIHITPKMPKNKHQRSAQRQTPENSHNTEVFKNKPENSSYSAESAQGQIDGEFTTQSRRTNIGESPHNGKSVHAQRIHNVEDAQEQIPGIIPENSLQITEIVKENSSHNAKSVQGQTSKNSPHNAESAQEQVSENSSHNAKDKHKEKELITQHRECSRKIHHTMPKVLENTH